jgi:hypothetical protein
MDEREPEDGGRQGSRAPARQDLEGFSYVNAIEHGFVTQGMANESVVLGWFCQDRRMTSSRSASAGSV